jgi:hypothetical protein
MKSMETLLAFNLISVFLITPHTQKIQVVNRPVFSGRMEVLFRDFVGIKISRERGVPERTFGGIIKYDV